MSRRACIVTTRTGIVIGGAYVPAPPAPTADAEEIQRVLLRRRLIVSPEFVAQRVDKQRAAASNVGAEPEWPPLTTKTLAIALAAIAAAVLISACLPMGVLTR